jgi:hypothetical protein
MICTCRDPMALGVVHRADAPCYIPEPKREWQGLTDEERTEIRSKVQEYTAMDNIQYGLAVQHATEAKLKELNT